jgi:hypothetical protein
MNDVSVFAEYVIEFEDLEKVVPNETKAFFEKAEEVLLIIKMTSDEDYNFKMRDMYEYCGRDDIEGSNIYNLLDANTWDLVEDKLSEVYNLLTDVFHAFEKQTGVGVNIEMNYETDKHYFYLVKDDVVQLTPQAKKLEQMGIKLELEQWSESW